MHSTQASTQAWTSTLHGHCFASRGMAKTPRPSKGQLRAAQREQQKTQLKEQLRSIAKHNPELGNTSHFAQDNPMPLVFLHEDLPLDTCDSVASNVLRHVRICGK